MNQILFNLKKCQWIFKTLSVKILLNIFSLIAELKDLYLEIENTSEFVVILIKYVTLRSIIWSIKSIQRSDFAVIFLTNCLCFDSACIDRAFRQDTQKTDCKFPHRLIGDDFLLKIYRLYIKHWIQDWCKKFWYMNWLNLLKKMYSKI